MPCRSRSHTFRAAAGVPEMYLIGLTGGIASGKSTIGRMLAGYGAVVIDADQVARDVVEPGTEALREIVRQFGPSVITEEGALDRPRLGELVFASDDARRRLNAIVHPAVRARTRSLIERAAQEDPEAVIVYDVPLLAESESREDFDLIVVASAPEDLRTDRLVRIRGMSPSQARARISAQADDSQREAIADHLIDTSGTLENTLLAVAALWDDVIAPARG